jgi:hypothetical protein
VYQDLMEASITCLKHKLLTEISNSLNSESPRFHWILFVTNSDFKQWLWPLVLLDHQLTL